MPMYFVLRDRLDKVDEALLFFPKDVEGDLANGFVCHGKRNQCSEKALFPQVLAHMTYKLRYL